ncbi:hypothetical protein APSETT444_001939 [Aspergillus pseudonomiae]
MSPEELDALLEAPALVPPPGVTPNFDNPSSHNDYAWGITTGAYWGTAYAAYGMIYTPGYYVHTWDLRNRDLIRPLYVGFSLFARMADPS